MSVKTINIKEVAEKVLNKKELFILDVRNEADFEDWKIEGSHFEYLNKPYFDLLDGVEPIADKVPKDREVVVVCARGKSSQVVSEMLVEEGFDNIYSLEGGMKAWSEHLEPVKVADLTNGGELYQFVRLGKGCLSYMIISNGEAATVDAVRMTDVFTDFAEEKGAKIVHALDTHLHADHISGGPQLAKKTGATYWLPPKDATEVQFEYTSIEDDAEIEIGSSKIGVQALYSPGHTEGSTSYIVDEKYLMSGDILFVDSIGRPDLAGKAEDWVGDLRETLYHRYKNVSQDLVVLPAHFMTNKELNEDGSVGQKLGTLFEENHGLNVADQDEFRRLVTENLPPQPNAYHEIRETNMGKVSPEIDKQREMETGPNRCAVK